MKILKKSFLINFIIYFFIICFLNKNICAQAPEILWQKSYGGSSWDRATSILETPDSGYIVGGHTGSADGDILTNHGLEDIWLLKLNSSGSTEWQKSFGGSNNELFKDICITTDGGFIIAGGSYSSDGDVIGNHGNIDVWIVKTNADGNIDWQRCYGGSSQEYAESIAQTSDGGYIIGATSNSVDGNVLAHHGTVSTSDIWVIKIDMLGNIEWEKSLGSSLNDYVGEVIESTYDGYMIAGTSTSNGGDVIGNHGGSDYWIVKINETGDLIWQKCYGGTQTDLSEDIIETSDGNFLVGGQVHSNNIDVTGFHGGSDSWIIKIDSVGNLIWKKCYGGNEFEVAYKIMETTENEYIYCMAAESEDGDLTDNYGFEDVWIMKTDTNGNLIWQKTYGGTNFEEMFSIIQSIDNNFVMAGYSRSNDFDLTLNHGDFDYWVVKLGVCTTKYFADLDGDGFGDIFLDSIACNPPLGFVTDSTDCNDANNLIFPTAEDICNTMDDNCNGSVDEDAIFTTWYLDVDEDNFGDITNDSVSCFELTGYVNDNSDCNDLDALISPEAMEICNDMDDNCNFDIDEGLTVYTLYADADGDGSGDPEIFISSCLEVIFGYELDSTDCNDSSNLIYPGATEVCDYLDNDCNGIIDDNLTYIHSYEDADGDEFGNINVDSLSCEIPDGFVEDESDCDDKNPFIFPGADEILNGQDDNCNLLIDEGIEIDESILSTVVLYPNPTVNILFIECLDARQSTFQLINATGEIIETFHKVYPITEINVSNYSAGIYFLKISNDSNEIGLKFVKE